MREIQEVADIRERVEALWQRLLSFERVVVEAEERAREGHDRALNLLGRLDRLEHAMAPAREVVARTRRKKPRERKRRR